MQLIPYETLVAKGVTASMVTLWRWERAGKFPKRVRISSQKVAWVESEVDAWIADRVAERN